jgi:hypothetical protein
MAKLNKMLGAARAEVLYHELLGPLDGQVKTPDQLMQVANALIEKGGLTKMIGHSLKMEALLRGAQR